MRRFDPKDVYRRMTEPRRYSDADVRRQQLEPITRGLSWKAKHAVCREHHAHLSQTEQAFIFDLHVRWWKRDYLTPKQEQWLTKIYEQLVFERGVHYRATYGE